MSNGINKVILIGTLGADPLVTKNEKGQFARLSIATSDSYKDKTTGEVKKNTEWHKVVCFGKASEIAERILKKGSKAYICGSIKTRKYVDKNNLEKEITEIIAHEIQALNFSPAPKAVANGNKINDPFDKSMEAPW